ncbi:MAG: hypothetical protein Q8L73_12885 [Methylotenera sp.]|nr:hypothetical protein [Methylotenera sp.]
MINIKFLFMLLVPLVISGCASNGPQKDVSTQKIDRMSEEELLRIMPKPVATVSLDDLVKLTKEGVAADQIIEKIKASNSSYDLRPSQTVELSKQGVDNKVLDYIHASRELALRNSIADEINKREKIKQLELDKLKREQRLQQYPYDPFCRFSRYGFYPYGYGAYGSRFGSRFGGGIGFGVPLGCW